MRSNGPVRFSEVQRFRDEGFWILSLVIGIVPNVLFAFGIYQQLILGKPFGSNPMTDAGLLVAAFATLVITTLVSGALFLSRLETRVTDEALEIRFFPFHRRPLIFRRTELEEVEARQYRPIVEYGGWGIRFSLTGRGRAYNVSGDRGVQLVLRDGRRILIGSQNADALAAALKA